jgi:hypothetical protein
MSVKVTEETSKYSRVASKGTSCPDCECMWLTHRCNLASERPCARLGVGAALCGVGEECLHMAAQRAEVTVVV